MDNGIDILADDATHIGWQATLIEQIEAAVAPGHGTDSGRILGLDRAGLAFHHNGKLVRPDAGR